MISPFLRRGAFFLPKMSPKHGNVTSPFIHKNPYRWATLALFLGALALRVFRLPLAPFNIDEALLALYARQIALAARFPLEGILTSFGFHNPPLLPYLAAPFFRIHPSPLFAMTALCLINSAGIFLLMDAARRMADKKTALLAGFLFALAPLSAEYARRLWGHDTILFWGCLCWFGAVRAATLEKRRYLFLAGLAAAAAQCCHLSGLVYWLIPLGTACLFPRKKWALPLLAAGTALALCYLPWLIVDGTERNFQEIQSIGLMLTGGKVPTRNPQPLPNYLVWFTLLADGWNHNALAVTYDYFLEKRPLLHGGLRLIRLISALAIVLSLAAALRPLGSPRKVAPEKRLPLLAAFAVLMPLLLFSLLPGPAVPPYQLPALPALCLLTAWASSLLWCHPSRGLFSMAAGIALWGWALIALSYTFSSRNFLAQADHRLPLTVPYQAKKEAIADIVQRGGHYALRQEARSREEGIDYPLIYLHAWLSGSNWLPLSPAAEEIYLFHETRLHLPPASLRWLETQPKARYTGLSVYHLDQTDLDVWQEDCQDFREN